MPKYFWTPLFIDPSGQVIPLARLGQGVKLFRCDRGQDFATVQRNHCSQCRPSPCDFQKTSLGKLALSVCSCTPPEIYVLPFAAGLGRLRFDKELVDNISHRRVRQRQVMKKGPHFVSMCAPPRGGVRRHHLISLTPDFRVRDVLNLQAHSSSRFIESLVLL